MKTKKYKYSNIDKINMETKANEQLIRDSNFSNTFFDLVRDRDKKPIPSSFFGDATNNHSSIAKHKKISDTNATGITKIMFLTKDKRFYYKLKHKDSGLSLFCKVRFSKNAMRKLKRYNKKIYANFFNKYTTYDLYFTDKRIKKYTNYEHKKGIMREITRIPNYLKVMGNKIKSKKIFQDIPINNHDYNILNNLVVSKSIRDMLTAINTTE